jgi:hypothetical protein
MYALSQLMQRVTFEADTRARAPYSRIHNALEEYPFVRITGLFSPDEALAAREMITNRFDNGNDRKHDPRDSEAIRGNLQKLQVGGVTISHGVPRFLRMLYNPIFAPDIYQMRGLFIRLSRFRNTLYGLPPDFAIHGTDDGLWTASRIHQYPTGGGFMAAHRDEVTAAVARAAGLKTYLQPYLLLSKKGTHFQTGGAFIEYEGDTLEYEDCCDAGDVIVYNEQVVHGVADIDPLQPLELTTFCGRVNAFVTLFRHLKPLSTEKGALVAPSGAPH